MRSAREDFYRPQFKPRKPRSLVPWTLVMLVLMALFVVKSASPQLQQSGGGGSNASVGATGATAPTSATLAGGTYNTSLPTLSNTQMGSDQLDVNGRLITVGAGTGGTPAGGVMSIQGVSSGTVVPVSGTVSVNALVAGTALIGYTRPQNACGTTNYESVMTNPPSSATSLTATTTCVLEIFVSNITGSAATITVQDQGTGCNSAACVWIDAFSIPANSNMAIPLYGMKFASGIKWSQGTANALSADIIGNQ
jgi:hypothetical protein